MLRLDLSYPPAHRLEDALRSGLEARGLAPRHLEVRDRQPNLYGSLAPSELVTCRVDHGSDVRILCKYAPLHEDRSYGYRAGIAHEAKIYRELLQPSPLTTARFYGYHEDRTSGARWLMVEYLEGAVAINKAADSMALAEAARWIARFHAEQGPRLADQQTALGLKAHDPEFYAGWSRRTLAFAQAGSKRLPWLRPLCEGFEDYAVELLATAPASIVHGEYCPQNVLELGGDIYPVDWETCAIAPGVTDLANLTDGWWAAEIVHACEDIYRATRWSNGVPGDFELTLAAARLYVQFRWLGEDPDALCAASWRLDALRAAGECLELI